MEFTPSPRFTVGMELELQLLDADTLDLADGIVRLLDLYPGSKHIKPEFIQNTVEIASPVCSSLAELERHMRNCVDELKDRCSRMGMRLAAAGTHPFSRRLGLITPKPRYQQMEQEHGHIAHTQVTFATHVHVGLGSGDEAIALMREAKAYLPVLIALSANSPFWRGYDTAFAAYRHRILAASRSYGIPPNFDDWAAFTDFLAVTKHAGVFDDVHAIHWDLRPRPNWGTLEFRVMDAQSTIDAAMAVAAIARFLTYYLNTIPAEQRRARLPRTLPWWLEKENYYQASRLGRAARFIADAAGSVLPLSTVIDETLLALEPAAMELHETNYYQRLLAFSRAPLGYEQQRQYFAANKDMKDIVTALIQSL